MLHDFEDQILAAVQNVLGRSDIGLDDDFFEVGGSSLLVVRAIATLREQGVHVPARAFVESSHLREIATLAEPAT